MIAKEMVGTTFYLLFLLQVLEYKKHSESKVIL
jgi:hypothetical protein